MRDFQGDILVDSYQSRRLQELRDNTRLVHLDKDSVVAKRLFGIQKLPDEEKKELVDIIASASEKAGNWALLRAFEEKVLSEQEWLEIKEKRGLTISDMGCILLPFFKNRDNPDGSLDDIIVIMTLEGSNIYNQRDFIKERFWVNVTTPDEIKELEMKK